MPLTPLTSQAQRGVSGSKPHVPPSHVGSAIGAPLLAITGTTEHTRALRLSCLHPTHAHFRPGDSPVRGAFGDWLKVFTAVAHGQGTAMQPCPEQLLPSLTGHRDAVGQGSPNESQRSLREDSRK